MARLSEPMRRDVDRLIADHPVGTVVSIGHGDALSTPLLFLFDRADDPAGVLYGQFSAGNPQVSLLRTEPRALVLFQGPGSANGGELGQTHGYRFAEFLVEVEFLDGTAARSEVERRFARFGEEWPFLATGHQWRVPPGGLRPFRAWVLRTRTRFAPLNGARATEDGSDAGGRLLTRVSG
jgi:hypothetical protein